MSIFRTKGLLVLAALMLVLAGLACGQLTLPQDLQQKEPFWTPAPAGEVTPLASATAEVATSVPAAATAGPTVETAAPAITEAATAALSTVEPAAGGGASAAGTGSLAGELPTEAPTADPHHIVITEGDIAGVIATEAGGNGDVQTQGLAVHFAGGKTRITADSVQYGMFTVNNVAVTGVLVARDGALQLDAESVAPQGLVGAVLPGMINQALRQYASRWYVEDVQTLDGRIELRIR